MSWNNSNGSNQGVPLAHYLNDRLMGVRFQCLDCQKTTDVATAEVVERLKAAGLGDERTGIRALAWIATKPCGRCGARHWEVRPAHRPMLRRR